MNHTFTSHGRFGGDSDVVVDDCEDLPDFDDHEEAEIADFEARQAYSDATM